MKRHIKIKKSRSVKQPFYYVSIADNGKKLNHSETFTTRAMLLKSVNEYYPEWTVVDTTVKKKK